MTDSIKLGTCVAAAAVLAFFAVSARADLVAWQAQASGTSGNVTASTNGGSGWTLDGTAGVAYDYGNLDYLGGKPVDGSTVEYIFNFSDNRASIALGSMYAWSPGAEKIVYKLEQWSNTGKFGLTWAGYADYSLTTPSMFNQDVDVVFRRNNDTGTIDMFINGVYAETNTNKTNWRMDGGVGMIGANFAGTADFALGTMYGVASYDKPLSDTEIYNLHNAYTVPEPATVGMLGLFGVSALLRRRILLKK